MPGYRGVFAALFASEQSIRKFVGTVDTLMEEGQVLKRDPASFVSRVLWNGQDVVIKRYNHRGLCHSLRHTIKGSRARRSWYGAEKLLSLRIATPEPLGYLEHYQGRLLWQSYLITRFVHGSPVNRIFRGEEYTEMQKRRVGDQIMHLLREMAEHGISHGDMKHTNLLFDGTGIVLMDLDGMRIGGAPWLRRRRCRRDVNRYLRSLPAMNRPS